MARPWDDSELKTLRRAVPRRRRIRRPNKAKQRCLRDARASCFRRGARGARAWERSPGRETSGGTRAGPRGPRRHGEGRPLAPDRRARRHGAGQARLLREVQGTPQGGAARRAAGAETRPLARRFKRTAPAFRRCKNQPKRSSPRRRPPVPASPGASSRGRRQVSPEAVFASSWAARRPALRRARRRARRAAVDRRGSSSTAVAGRRAPEGRPERDVVGVFGPRVVQPGDGASGDPHGPRRAAP